MIWACHYYKNTNRQTKIPKRDTLFDFLPDQQFHHVHLSTMSTMSNSNVIWGLTITSSQSDFRGLSVIQWKTGSVLGRTHIDYIYPWMERVKMSNCIVDCLLHVNIWILTNAGQSVTVLIFGIKFFRYRFRYHLKKTENSRDWDITLCAGASIHVVTSWTWVLADSSGQELSMIVA